MLEERAITAAAIGAGSMAGLAAYGVSLWPAVMVGIIAAMARLMRGVGRDGAPPKPQRIFAGFCFAGFVGALTAAGIDAFLTPWLASHESLSARDAFMLFAIAALAYFSDQLMDGAEVVAERWRNDPFRTIAKARRALGGRDGSDDGLGGDRAP